MIGLNEHTDSERGNPLLSPYGLLFPIGEGGGGRTSYVPVSTEGSGTPTTRPGTGTPV